MKINVVTLQVCCTPTSWSRLFYRHSNIKTTVYRGTVTKGKFDKTGSNRQAKITKIKQ